MPVDEVVKLEGSGATKASTQPAIHIPEEPKYLLFTHSALPELRALQLVRPTL